MKRRLGKIFLIVILIGATLALATCAVLNQARFGKFPEGERLERVHASPNHKLGEFQNTVPTPMLIEGESSLKIMLGKFFAEKARLRPQEPLPTVKLDLASLDSEKDIVIWLGHSSYFIQLGSKRILVDPIFNDYGAPFSFLNKTFPGTDIYTVADMPEIDYLIISHDHWDHLDYATVTALMPKVKAVVMPLGVGAHFEHWGYTKDELMEADWNTALRFENGFSIHVLPARHYSGRTFTRNKTLWAGFVLETPEKRIFLSGDTGYGPHIAEIAAMFGSFDLVAIDGGQYDPRWPFIHMTPEEVAQSAEELGAKTLLLAHVGKFSIADHPWDEPFERVVEASKGRAFRLLTPKIGEPVLLNNAGQNFTRWWENIQ
jgi:L-ascorbate metabolism protein UlaG (beta-lactamase superfamily)